MTVAAAAAALTLVAAPTVAAAAPAGAAAYPTSYFLVKDGTGGYFSGRVTWYNRSVGIVGSLNSSGCERALARSLVDTKQLDAKSTSLRCNTVTSFNVSLSADVPGGANRVYVDLTDEYGAVLDFQNCFLGSADCV
ncbi:hypothetical protein ABZU76_36325 [Amycolatopsis sp. NPDC005232]|uniref:hypothetical protein n=1 Tax=Amycolatopsis sp. NPDC005232 TaxID=3157027 RepID=UPI0033B6F7F9